LAAFGLTGTLLVARSPQQWRAILAIACAGTCVAAGLVLHSITLFDLYYDSQVYHLPSIILLRDGWNPIYHGHPCGGPSPWIDVRFCDLLYSYPKASWITSAVVYDLTGEMEAGKFWNFWHGIALGLTAYLFFKRINGLARFKAALFACVIAANPVIVSELGSNYVDAQLSAQLAILCILVLDSLIFDTPGRRMLAAASLILINLKFTGLAFGLIFLSVLGVAGMAVGRSKRVLHMGRIIAPAFLFGVVAIGFNPYVTNTLEYQNPFTPAYSLDKGASVIKGQADPEFLAKGRVDKFLISTFSVSDDSDWKRPRYQRPFASLRATPLMGNRFSGFGPLYSGILIIAFGLAILVRGRLAWIVIAGIACSMFIVPTAWWARLTPQGWWLPLAVLIPVCIRGKSRVVEAIATAALILMLFNASLKLQAVTQHQRDITQRKAEVITQIAAESHTVAIATSVGPNARAFYFTNRRRLLDRSIDFVETQDRTCEKPLRLDGLEACPQR